MTHPTDPEAPTPRTGSAGAQDLPPTADHEAPTPAVPDTPEPAQSWFARSVPDTPEPAQSWSAPDTPEPTRAWSTPSVPDTPEPAQSWPAQSVPDAGVGEVPQSEGASQGVAAQPDVGSLPASSIPPLPAAAPLPKRRGGLVAVVVLILVGLLGLLGGGAALGWELTRKATKAEQAAALRTEIASRWQRLPAGKIFPATISYKNSEGYATTATRVGVAPQTSCASALEQSAVHTFHSDGCSAVLRATYVDESGTLVATVGIAVMPSEFAAFSAQSDVQAVDSGDSLRAMPIASTIASNFSDAQRGAAEAQFAGPYVFFYTAGYTDGMPSAAAGTGAELTALGDGILGVLEPTMTKHSSTCMMKDIKC
jgi:hypothetical protein